FCDSVDELYTCVGEKDVFRIGEEVHFRFVVESSTSNGEVRLVENYRIKGTDGTILLDVNDENNYLFNIQSNKKNENIYFKDHIITEIGDNVGEYTIELLIENVLLNKKSTLIKKFNLKP
ncbi:MAG: hypothetical protein Q7K45_01715, partial [Nanoarchaeota archaeon]|nr:hypothetical protein [Nanoarchaeota archaeon]